MKFLFFASFLILSFSSHALETLSGKFTLNDSDYRLSVSYDLAKNQEATSKNVSYFESFLLPESNEEFPAHCSYNMHFTVPYKVIIKKVSTGEVVYSKNGVESFLGSAEGGLISEQKCLWVIDGWEAKVPSQLRINEHFFKIENNSYRFILDTYALISVKGSKAATLSAQSFSPLKGHDGKKDGEVWLDTQPDQFGNYNRIWFSLSL